MSKRERRENVKMKMKIENREIENRENTLVVRMRARIYVTRRTRQMTPKNAEGEKGCKNQRQVRF